MKTMMLTALILISAVCSQAQKKVAAHGFWVVESNVNQPKVQTIRFYTDDAKLIYEETINAKLNLKREKIQLALNELSNKLTEGKDNLENKKLIAVAFNLRR